MNYALYEIMEDELVFDLTDHIKVNRDGFFLFPTSQEEAMTSQATTEFNCTKIIKSFTGKTFYLSPASRTQRNPM